MRSSSAASVLLALALLSALGACAAASASRAAAPGGGALLLIGGGLDDDDRDVYQRFCELAARPGAPRLVVVTAATGDQEVEAVDKSESLRIWAPTADIEVVRRETPTDATVAAIDAATGLLFTGGDQKRITERYRPGGAATPEWEAMRRLLARGGVIAGGSAGCAMMGERMLLSGRSAAALGLADPVDADGNPRTLGPQVGPGLGFLSSLITDSHFFERDRVGRLVAALEDSGQRLGLGVGECAAVEVDLASGDLVGVTAMESLLVDAGALQRDGLARRGLRARRIGRGDRVSVSAMLAAPAAALPPAPSGAAAVVPIVEAGQNRQLASWRLFARADVAPGTVVLLHLDGHTVRAWSAGGGEIAFELVPAGR